MRISSARYESSTPYSRLRGPDALRVASAASCSSASPSSCSPSFACACPSVEETRAYQWILDSLFANAAGPDVEESARRDRLAERSVRCRRLEQLDQEVRDAPGRIRFAARLREADARRDHASDDRRQHERRRDHADAVAARELPHAIERPGRPRENGLVLLMTSNVGGELRRRGVAIVRLSLECAERDPLELPS
jgi:hypothetical protein